MNTSPEAMTDLQLYEVWVAKLDNCRARLLDVQKVMESLGVDCGDTFGPVYRKLETHYTTLKRLIKLLELEDTLKPEDEDK